MQNRQESREDESGIRLSELSRRSFIRAGTVAAGMSIVGLSSVGLAGPAFAASGHDGRPYEVRPFGPVDVTPSNINGSYARAVRFSTSKPGQPRPLLATYQAFGGTPFPLYRSNDDGHTWAQQGSVLGADAPPVSTCSRICTSSRMPSPGCRRARCSSRATTGRPKPRHRSRSRARTSSSTPVRMAASPGSS